MANMWMVRAGVNGIYIDDFKDLGVVAVGWVKLGNLINKNHNDIKSLVKEAYTEYNNRTIGVQSAQLNKFVNEFKIGDYVISFDSSNDMYIVGKIISDYYYSSKLVDYREDCHFRNIRDVEWIGNVKKEDLSITTKKSLKSATTIFNINDLSQKDILNHLNKFIGWTEFYMEFADKLLEFKDNRVELIDKIYKIFSELNINLAKLDSDDDGKPIKPFDIDPFTVFALFNKQISDERRVNIINSFKKEFLIESNVPNIFNGIPVLSNMNAAFYVFGRERKKDDIQNLWDVFEYGLNYSKNDENSRKKFITAYNKVIEQKGVSWNITIGLFWFRPKTFINLDSKNRKALGNNDIFTNDFKSKIKSLKNIPNGEEYLRICNESYESIKKSNKYKDFVDFSSRSYFTNKQSKMVIVEYFKDILDKYPLDIKKSENEDALKYWLENKFYLELNGFLYNELLFSSNYNFKLNSVGRKFLPSFLEIDLFNDEFLVNHFNEFYSYILFNHYQRELEIGLKVSRSKDYLIHHRLTFLLNNLKEFGNYSFKGNKIVISKISYDNIKDKNIISSIDLVKEFYEKLIPGYILYLKNEVLQIDIDEGKNVWVLDLSKNNQISAGLWDDFKNNSYITNSVMYENNNINFADFKNYYAIDVFFSNRLSKKQVINTFEFINYIKLNDLIIVCENGYLKGICKIKSKFKGIENDNLNNCYSVKCIAKLDHLDIEFNSKSDFYELSSQKINRLIFNLAKYNKKLFTKLMFVLNQSFEKFELKKIDFSNEYQENIKYVNDTFEQISIKYKNGEDISDDVWDRLINWCFDSDAKSKIDNSNNFSKKELDDIAISFFNTLDGVTKTSNINKQKSIIKDFAKIYNFNSLRFDLTNHFIKILHFLNSNFCFLDKNIIKTLNLLSLLCGYEVNIEKNLESYIEFNIELNQYLSFIKNNTYFDIFRLNDFKDFYIFSQLLCDVNLGNYYSNNPTLLNINLIYGVGDYELIKWNPKLDLNHKLLKVQLGNFSISKNTINHVCASLNAGKHIILDGTPGTGKTDLASIFAVSCFKNHFIDGYVMTTATSDWSTFDTIGGLMPNNEGLLEFHEGKFLQSIRENKWLIIDEINRSDIDKAFGPLFTVLSGHDVEIPYKLNNQTIKIKNWDEFYSKFDIETSTYYIGKNWRILGTMNVDDKDSLFDLSYAFMRRFMFIEVDIPPQEEYKEIISIWANDLNEEYLNKLIEIYDINKYRKLGPAIFKDMIEYIRQRDRLDALEYNQVLGEAIDSYILPQLEGMNRKTIKDIENFFDEIGLLENISDKFKDLTLDL